ncbi:MAG: hypothetical protein IT437_09640 [Phycisphaerales bacterium]|nr:hypothetical protein [Phycisphaerales bacterium]
MIARHDAEAVFLVGRRCWVCPTAAESRWPVYYIDARSDAERLWAIDQVLRCPGSTVLGDATRFSMAASRRLQLAAEAGGTLALLTRPPWERGVISAAATRWQVTPWCRAPMESVGGQDPPRWSLELFRCKGSPLAGPVRGVVEVRGETVALHRVAGMVDRPDPAAASARRIA